MEDNVRNFAPSDVSTQISELSSEMDQMDPMACNVDHTAAVPFVGGFNSTLKYQIHIIRGRCPRSLNLWWASRSRIPVSGDPQAHYFAASHVSNTERSEENDQSQLMKTCTIVLGNVVLDGPNDRSMGPGHGVDALTSVGLIPTLRLMGTTRVSRVAIICCY